MGSNDDDDVDGGVRFVLTQQDFQLILICIVRVGVAAACVEKHVEDVVLYFDGDFDDGRSSGLDRRPADFESRGNDGPSRGRDDLRELLAGETTEHPAGATIFESFWPGKNRHRRVR